MKTSIILIAILTATVAPILAQVPETMSYQGVLKNIDGTPVPDGDYNLTFRIYDVDTGGTELWSETQMVTATEGAFNAILGSSNPLGLAFDVQYWLGIQIDTGQELAPRFQLAATPYSLNVSAGKVVKSLNGLTDVVTLAAGSNVAIESSSDTLTISMEPITTEHFINALHLMDPNQPRLAEFYYAVNTVGIQASTSTTNFQVQIPVDVPAKIGGVQQKLQSMTIYFMVNNPADYINDTIVMLSFMNGGWWDILRDENDYYSPGFTSYTLTSQNPDDITGPLVLILDLYIEQPGSNHQVIISGVKVVTSS